MLNFIKKMFGIDVDYKEPKLSSKPTVRYFYARDWKKKERVVSVARLVDCKNSMVSYAWCMNDPRFDRFSKKEARRILKEQLEASPKCKTIALTAGERPVSAVVHDMINCAEIPVTARKYVEKWFYGNHEFIR
jgi:hypothetical protein